MSESTEPSEATATQVPASPRRPANPFAVRIRLTSNQIARLLQRFEEFKAGWTQYRIQYQNEKGEISLSIETFRSLDQAETFLNTKIKPEAPSGYSFEVVTEQIGPQITLSSDPESLFETMNITEPQTNPDSKEKPQVTNPLLNAVMRLGEFEYKDAVIQETITKVGVIRALGVEANLECSCLIRWARELAACFTYLLECKTTYSEEMKAKYSELLADLNNARGIADRVIRTVGNNKGYLTVNEFNTHVGDLVRLATIIRKSSLQLADYHDEFMAGRGGGGTPIEVGSESIEWVLEGEEEKPKRPPPKTEEELPEEGGKA